MEKVVIVGDSAVGKSSIVIRFVNNEFKESIKSTVGCDQFEKVVDVGSEKVKFSLWDTAGQERFRGLASSYYKKAKGVVIVFDITKKASFDKLEFWKDEISNYLDETVPVILLGNKTDLAEKRVVQAEDGEKFVKKYHYLAYFETSAKEASNSKIQEAFSLVAKSIVERKRKDGGAINEETKGGVNRKNVDLDHPAEGEKSSDCKC